jgi:Domain of unknown function (DUF1772)
MNRSAESLIRFINLTSAGLLAGSLGFGEAALTPGWQDERGHDAFHERAETPGFFNAIGPIALASAVTLAVGGKASRAGRRLLDSVSAVALIGVLATTTLVTVPLARKLDLTAPADYPGADSTTMAKNWSRAHAIRTALGISAFVCAVASNAMPDKRCAAQSR